MYHLTILGKNLRVGRQMASYQQIFYKVLYEGATDSLAISSADEESIDGLIVNTILELPQRKPRSQRRIKVHLTGDFNEGASNKVEKILRLYAKAENISIGFEYTDFNEIPSRG